MSNFFTKERVLSLLYVVTGAFILAVSINSVLLPNQIVAGGANGISIIINHLFGITPALTLYVINGPLLILCFWLLGKEVGMKTIFGSMLYPFFVGITANFPVLTYNPLLAAIFGGIITGLGLGLVFKGNASTGGTAILSQIVNKYLRIPLGVAVSFVDGFVILAALVAFNVETVLYSLISLFVIGRVVDLVQVSFDRSKNILIISKETAKIESLILAELDRGVTRIPIQGGYHKGDQTMLMCVIPEKEFHNLREQVLKLDPHSFVVAMAASEVMGKGFSLGR
ncbi:YitT family protein [Vagococcus salmoninarum]|uniref:DUF2179 domain-containing protein n=1 Tax=Vagococcus salmoninarum TaxID=2739 RepID=A0A429ZAT6_9ENTE|nr:YitT family protein [Vagococcus salmoninarum]RST90804.1 hypothetical protein CBF35_14985 [Vagococcus salmoninarum]